MTNAASPAPKSTTSAPDVLVVGGGAVGVSVAAELAERGASVTLLERGPELAWGCSAGNAGLLGASHVLPLANPEALIDGLRWLPRSDSPFGMRPRPRLMPWLARFTAASAPHRYKRTERILRELAIAGAASHEELAAAGLDTGFQRRGLLNVYGKRRAFNAARRAAEQDARDGLRSEIVEGAEVKARFPVLAGEPAGAVFYPDETHCDATQFVKAMGERAAAAGARLRTGVEVLAIRSENGRVRSLWTTEGEMTAGEVVLAAGVWSPELVDGLPIRLPVEGGKGYHIDVEPWAGAPDHPVWFQEERIVATPLEGRLRLAGTLELAGVDLSVDHRRVDAIIRAARTGLRGFVAPKVREVWRGLRPCSPDGLPIIGRTPGLPNLVLATGHGMWGLQLGPLTGRLVGSILTGGTPAHDLAPMRPGRFRVGG
jgi:D-amino-acid dehydrogenase